MEIYFIRHGQSEANARRVHAGQFDAPLTELGREQAREAGRRLKGIKFDKVFASDLSRASETAELSLPGCSYKTDARLREILLGDAMIGKTRAQCTAELGEAYVNATKTLDFTPLAGENRQMLYDRAMSFLEDLKELDCERVAVFCHEGLIREVLCGVVGSDVRGRVLFPNCVIGVFELSDGKMKLARWNI